MPRPKTTVPIFLLIIMLTLTTVGYARTVELQRVSIDDKHNQANQGSFNPAISANGRFVAFTSGANNLIENDTNHALDIFVHDRTKATTSRISINSVGDEANNQSTAPAISADGQIVTFVSQATNLTPDDSNGVADIFVYNRATGVTKRVSVNSAGYQANDLSHDPHISADGRYIVFASAATNLVPDDTNGYPDVFVHDQTTGVTQRVSVDNAGQQANHESGSPHISADGRFIVFHATATNLVDSDTNLAADIFVHDRTTGTTQRVSIADDGQQANNISRSPHISADGRYITFYSNASNLVMRDTNNQPDIFVYDRLESTIRRVSVDSNGVQADNASLGSAISGDGRYITFYSEATNLVRNDTNHNTDIFMHDQITGLTTRVSVTGQANQADNVSLGSAISTDGEYVTFYSSATNLVAGDTNGYSDIYVAQLDGRTNRAD